MRTEQSNVLDALRATQRFLDTYKDVLADVELTSARAALDRAAEQLAVHAVIQNTGIRTAREESARQRKLRRAIRTEYMRPIAAIARRSLRQAPEFSALRVPPSGLVGNRFIAAAEDMAKAGEKHAAILEARGLPAKFVDGLRKKTEELASSLTARSEGHGKRVGATVGLVMEASEARMLFRVLDARVRPAIAGNDPLVREWVASIAISKRGGAVGGGTSTEPAIVPTPAPTRVTPVTPTPTPATTPSLAAA